MTDEEKWIGTTQAAQKTGLSRRTLQEYAEDGKLPSYKVGRNVLFKLPELVAWMESHRRPAVQGARR
jgi:excisionase family DNA binding protein